MGEKTSVILGLLIFVGLVTLPVWYELAVGQGSKGLNLKLPAAEKECVAPIAFMKASHMKLLKQWRDQVVRNNVRIYTAYNGRTYNMSLSGTCLQQCHTEKAEFCDRCHAFNGVPGPSCWDCHVDPGLARRTMPQAGAEGMGGEDGGR